MSPVHGTRVVVGMSGGVDSSVAAALLKRQGYEVIGVMLRLWSESGLENRCCAPDAQIEARQTAGQLEIPFYVMDAQTEFYQSVVEPFVDGYAHGYTPNPCLNCNRFIRWKFLVERARILGADLIATGHYARIQQETSGIYRLLKNPDPEKDQSYFLHILTQQDLSQTLFPLSELSKPQVRHLAEEFQLKAADRPDSQDLCFVGGTDYRDFLRQINPASIQPGPILDLQGNQLGEHTGLADFTIGQRKGLKIPGPEPYFVLEKRIKENTLVIGPKNSLVKDTFRVADINWISGKEPLEPISLEIRIRYKSRAVPGRVQPVGGGRAVVNLGTGLPDITPGQAAVFYQGETCLGGGIIQWEAE